MTYYEVCAREGHTNRTMLVYGDTPEGAIQTARKLFLQGVITEVRQLKVAVTTHYPVSATSRWAKEHGRRVHPALKQALDDAKQYIDRGLWAFAVAGAFDAGVEAHDRLMEELGGCPETLEGPREQK